jgi:hypothetical protein
MSKTYQEALKELNEKRKANGLKYMIPKKDSDEDKALRDIMNGTVVAAPVAAAVAEKPKRGRPKKCACEAK